MIDHDDDNNYYISHWLSQNFYLEKTEGEEVNFGQSKFGIGQINRANKNGYTALHLACMNGHLVSFSIISLICMYFFSK